MTLGSEQEIPLKIFGKHNLENLKAAYLVCKELGVSDADFFETIQTFDGAAKRLQLLREEANFIAYLDFAHAPSKVAATISALSNQYRKRQLVACVELHTFSSLNRRFLKEYKGAMEQADEAIVFFSEHTLKMKQLPEILPADIQEAFDHPNLKVFTDNQKLSKHLNQQDWNKRNLLLMTSGTFNGLNLRSLVEEIKV